MSQEHLTTGSEVSEPQAPRCRAGEALPGHQKNKLAQESPRA